ncbi:MAG: tetratricopeptide repeat protein [Nitrosomonas sp.]|nr:tetratricopeptide repeat protein [Nitrosomonas sp.]
MNVKILGLLLPFGLVACGQVPVKNDVDELGRSAKQAEISMANLPKQELTAPILFDYLVGETALQRGYPEIAVKNYLKLAKVTRDHRIAQRATEIALGVQHPFAAEKAASMWTEFDPESSSANQTIAALLINMGRLDEARPHLEKLMAAEETMIDNAFMQLNTLLSRHADKVAVFTLVQHLAEPYPRIPEAHFAVSQSAWFAGQYDVALSEMEQALALRPDWETAAIYQGQILRRNNYTDAAEFYQNFVKKYPKANDTRVAFIRMLMEENNLDQAREQRELLLENNPSNADVALAVGLLSIDLDDLDVAETNLKTAIDLGYKDTSLVYFHLAQIYEDSQRAELAMDAYLKVTSGGQFLPAQIQYAYLLARQGNLIDARQHIQQLPAANELQTAHLILAEAQILRESGEHQEVFGLLSRGLEKLPNSPEILYDHALAADKIGNFDILEQNLQKLIQLRPDHAHAYNALGYSLAERGERLPEALKLIKRAVELSPGDAFIMDSLGWIYYRMGNIQDGLNYLNQAYAARPDPEIAAHLGEVLWVQGAENDAKKIWQSALKDHPENETLLETMKRLMR